MPEHLYLLLVYHLDLLHCQVYQQVNICQQYSTHNVTLSLVSFNLYAVMASTSIYATTPAPTSSILASILPSVPASGMCTCNEKSFSVCIHENDKRNDSLLSAATVEVTFL